MRLTTTFTGKYHLLCIRKWLILGLKAEKQFRKKTTAMIGHQVTIFVDSLDLIS